MGNGHSVRWRALITASSRSSWTTEEIQRLWVDAVGR